MAILWVVLFIFESYGNDRFFSDTNPYISNITQQCRCSTMLIFRAWATCGGRVGLVSYSFASHHLVSIHLKFTLHQAILFFNPIVRDIVCRSNTRSSIDLVTVFDAILTSRQTCEKLQCLYENLMSNDFRKTAVLKKNMTT